MSAYVIVDIEVTDPEGYQEMSSSRRDRALIRRPLFPPAADPMKRWKATGLPNDWSFWNSTMQAKPKRG